MMVLIKKNTKGYSLAEVIISLALLSILLLGGYCVLTTGTIIYIKDNVLLDMQEQTRNAVDRIVRESRPASSQTIVANYNSTTNDKITIISPITPSPGVVYYLSGINLVRSYAGNTQNVAGNISLLKFTLNASLLTIQATASQTISGLATSFPLVEKVRLRNE